MSKSWVDIKIPRAGLGNSLFVFAKGLLFAHLNGLEWRSRGWNSIKIGPYLRGEKGKRAYGKFFRKKSSGFNFGNLVSRNRRIHEADFDIFKASEKEGLVYTFTKIPHYSDYFEKIKQHRELVRDLLWNALSAEHKETITKLSSTTIGIHIRMGDFRNLKPGEDFKNVGLVRTPLDYFENIINSLREQCGANLPVTVFSDGFPEELAQVLKMDQVSLAPVHADIVDLYALSKCKIIVISAGSTFSLWSGFLSDSPIILHPDHIHSRVRIESRLFEGSLASFFQIQKDLNLIANE